MTDLMQKNKITSIDVVDRRGWQIGDRVKMANETHKIRRVITAICDGSTVETATTIRASKGYRRHARRMKAKA